MKQLQTDGCVKDERVPNAVCQRRESERNYYIISPRVIIKAIIIIFTRYVSNIIGLPSLTDEDLLVNGNFFNMEIVPMQMRMYRSCSHPVAAMILVMYVDNNGFCYNWSWCKNLRSLSSKMDALIYNVKESSIGFYRFAILMTRSPTLSVVAKRLHRSSEADATTSMENIGEQVYV